MQFFLFGGCVTRDIFRVTAKNEAVEQYFARTSVISQMSPYPMNMEMEAIPLKSNFQKRMVFNDLNKTFAGTIKKSEADYFILDFLVERFGLKQKGDAYYTISTEFVNAGLDKDSAYDFGKTRYRNDERLLAVWKEACDKFIEAISSEFPKEKIILHRAYWAKEYRTADGEVTSFTGKQLEAIEKNNRMLDIYYDYFEENCPGCHVIGMKEETPFIADESHQWGLNPMHYEEAYYEEMDHQIQGIIEKNEKRNQSFFEKLKAKIF